MSNAEGNQEFQDFMKWFELSYPELHQQYADKIIPPVNMKGLQVSQVGIDKTIYNTLFEIQNEYYISTM